MSWKSSVGTGTPKKTHKIITGNLWKEYFVKENKSELSSLCGFSWKQCCKRNFSKNKKLSPVCRCKLIELQDILTQVSKKVHKELFSVFYVFLSQLKTFHSLRLLACCPILQLQKPSTMPFSSKLTCIYTLFSLVLVLISWKRSWMLTALVLSCWVLSWMSSFPKRLSLCLIPLPCSTTTGCLAPVPIIR